MIAPLRALRRTDTQLASSGLGGQLIVAMTLLLFGLWMLFPPEIALRMPDTTSYLRFDAYRGAGYPLFLTVIQWFTNDLLHVVYIQVAGLFIAIGYAGIRLKQYTQSGLSGIFLILGIGANPIFIQYGFTLLTESLFFTSLIMIAGLLLQKKPSFDFLGLGR